MKACEKCTENLGKYATTYQYGCPDCWKLIQETIKEARFIIQTQQDCIDHLLGKKESFGSNETVGFGQKAKAWLEKNK